MVLTFGIRPFELEDFFRIIEQGQLDITKCNYIDVLSASLQGQFRHFEVTADLVYVLPGLLTIEVIQQLKKIKAENNYSCSVHLPLWGIELTSPNDYIRNASIKCLVEAIKLTQELDPICWVIHATGALVSEFTRIDIPDFAKMFMNNRFASTAQESIKRIIDSTKISSRKLAVENVEFPFKAMEDCIESLDLSICFDTGHLLAGYSGVWEQGVVDFYDTYHDRIIELHLHDGANPKIDHKPLGQFDLPVKELLFKLLETKFSGPVVFELNPNEVKESMIYIKKHVPEALNHSLD